MQENSMHYSNIIYQQDDEYEISSYNCINFFCKCKCIKNIIIFLYVK